MIELNGRLINPAHVAIIENMPGKEGYVRLYVGGVALITPGTIASVKAQIFGVPAGVLKDVEALIETPLSPMPPAAKKPKKKGEV